MCYFQPLAEGIGIRSAKFQLTPFTQPRSISLSLLADKDLPVSIPVRQEELTEEPPCPACGREELPAPVVFEASVFSQGQVLGLTRCPDCLVHFTRPRLVKHNTAVRGTTYERVLEKYGMAARTGDFNKKNNYAYYLRLAEKRLERGGRLKKSGCVP